MKLTKKHRMALNLLLEGNLTKAEIAECVKVSRKTLYNWLSDSDFSDELEELQNEQARMTKMRICSLTRKALDAQERILDTKNDAAAASVAKDVLDRAENAIKVLDDSSKGGGVVIIPAVVDDG